MISTNIAIRNILFEVKTRLSVKKKIQIFLFYWNLGNGFHFHVFIPNDK